MSETVGDFVVKRLSEWGVKRIYGYPGDGINGVLVAMARADPLIDFVQVRHEEMAAFMASAHAKYTGEVGVCLATSGPGAIHLLNGLYDALMDHQPVVALVGQAERISIGGNFQQEVDLQALFKDVAHEYVHTVEEPSQVRTLIDRAFRIAQAERTVTCIIFPKDVQDLKAEEPKHVYGAVHTGIGYSQPRVVPNDADLQHAAEVLNAGKKVAILVGAGAVKATDEVIQVADLLGAGIAKALLGRTVVPDTLPFVTGAIGLLGSAPSWELMANCDTLFMIGTAFPYSEFLPKEGQARAVQIDIDGKMLSLRYPTEVNLVGDSAETLRALIPYLQRKADRSWREKIEKNVADWWKIVEARAMNDARPLNPQRVFWELSPRLPDNCIFATDTGTSTFWFSRDLKMRRGMMASASGMLASMGNGVPYAIAAKFAYPERPVIAFVGDGAMQMNGLNELITIAKYWKRWANPQLIVLVLNNRDLNMVSWEQRSMEGAPKFKASQSLPDFPYALYADLIGLTGIRVDSPDAVASAWDQALAAKQPVVLEAVTDPDVPMLPPHITREQAQKYFSALMRGDEDAVGIIRQTIKDMSDSVIPH